MKYEKNEVTGGRVQSTNKMSTHKAGPDELGKSQADQICKQIRDLSTSGNDG